MAGVTAAAHRSRVVSAMHDEGIDVLVLGRESNARYVSGADRLWLAGTRAFAPGCVLVASTGEVHLLSITDDGVPSDLPPDRLFPIAWNPMTILGNVAAIGGVAGSRRIGVDGMTPMFEALLGAVVPGAELVDAESILRAVRRTKSPEDLAGLAAAVEAAEAALEAVCAALRPGVTEIALAGIFEEAMTASELTAPAFDAVCRVADAGAPAFGSPTEREVADGDRVHVRAGVMRDGWEGIVVRTLTSDGAPLRSPLLAGAIARCAPGAGVGNVRSMVAALEGTGMSHEELADGDTLEPDMVVFVEVLGGDIVDGATIHVRADGPAVFSAR
jgi:Xaa-Pro aminopeptidase